MGGSSRRRSGASGGSIVIVDNSTEYLSALNRASVLWRLAGDGDLLIYTLKGKLFQAAGTHRDAMG